MTFLRPRIGGLPAALSIDPLHPDPQYPIGAPLIKREGIGGGGNPSEAVKIAVSEGGKLEEILRLNSQAAAAFALEPGKKWRVLGLNEEMEGLSLFSGERALLMSVLDFFPEDVASQMDGKILALSAGKSPQREEILLRKQNGDLCSCKVQLKRANIGGEPIGFVYLDDVSELLALQEIVRHHMTEPPSSNSVTFNPEGTMIAVSLGMATFFGYRREELIGKEFTDILSPEQHDSYRAAFKSFVQTMSRKAERPRPTWRGEEFTGVTKDRRRLKLRILFDAFRTPEGEIRVTGTIEDAAVLARVRQKPAAASKAGTPASQGASRGRRRRIDPEGERSRLLAQLEAGRADFREKILKGDIEISFRGQFTEAFVEECCKDFIDSLNELCSDLPSPLPDRRKVTFLYQSESGQQRSLVFIKRDGGFIRLVSG